MENYERIEQIGTGKSGSFWKAKTKDTDQIVVIKEEKLQKKRIFKILKYPELRLLGVCRNSNLLQFIQLIKEYETLYIIMQYCEKNLQNEISVRESNPFKEDEIRYILSEICKGLKDIHDNKYVHRDICSKNIYITPNHLLLGDFSNIFCIRDKTECKYHGNSDYSSPEVDKDPSKADYKSDIYSLGCLLLELVNPIEFKQNISKIKESNKNDINWNDINLPSDISSDLLSLIKIMLENNIEQRISLDNVISHSFMSNGDLKNIYDDNNNRNSNENQHPILPPLNMGNNDLSPNSDSDNNNNNNNNNMINIEDSLESSIGDDIPSDTEDENINNPLLHLSFDRINTKSLYEEIAYRSSEEEEFNENEIRWFIKEMIKELSKFHGEKYVIRDISPKQLYFISNEMKIGVFHNAVNTEKESFPLKTPTSTYTAPEIINNLSYSNCSSDLFSIGCIMLELYNPGSYKMNIKVIETANNDESISWNLVKLPSNISDEGVEVLKGLLNMEIENRMTLDELSKHSFLSKETSQISPEARSLKRVSSHIGTLLALTHIATVESIEPTADHEVKATPRRYKQADKEELKETPKLTIEETDGVENESNSEFDFDDESFATNQESKENNSQVVPSLNIESKEENKEEEKEEENKMKASTDDDIENSSEEESERKTNKEELENSSEEEEEEEDDDDDDDEDDDDESSNSEEKKKKSKKTKKGEKGKDVKEKSTKKDNDEDKDGNIEGGMKPPEDDSESDDLENSEDDNNEDNEENRNKSSKDDSSNSDSNKKKEEEKNKNEIEEDEEDEEYDNFEEDDEERDEVADTVAEPTLPPELAGATTDLTTIDENAEEPQMLLPLNPNLTAQPKRKLRKATPSPQQLIAEANSTVIEGPSTFLKELPLNEMDEEDESIINEESEENYEGESM